MEPKVFNYEFPRGDTCPIKFDTINKITGEAFDLSVMDEIYFTIKKNYNESNALLQKRKSLGEIVVDGANATITLEHDDTKQWKYGTYVYDVQIKFGTKVKTILIGTIKLTNEATHYTNE